MGSNTGESLISPEPVLSSLVKSWVCCWKCFLCVLAKAFAQLNWKEVVPWDLFLCFCPQPVNDVQTLRPQ